MNVQNAANSPGGDGFDLRCPVLAHQQNLNHQLAHDRGATKKVSIKKQ